MNIAILAPFEETVPPKKYGGTELVVYNVIEELVKKGHQVTLVAAGNCQTSARLVKIFETTVREMPDAADMNFRNAYKYIGLGKVAEYLSQNKFDIIHNNIGWRLLAFEKILGSPVVTTLHGPLDVPYQQKVYGTYKSSNYVSISLSQRRPMPELNFVGNVYNGLDMTKFKFFPVPQDYFAFLGRMSPEKGPVQAIQAAKAAGIKLIMAAKVDTVDKAYFEKEVQPLIDGEQIKFIGEVDHAGKLELLGGAKALLGLIQWEEPFGLFFTESMACGTPVIAMNRGSVPELIKDGITGYICNTQEEAVAAIGKVNKLDRKTCFEHVLNNFSSVQMAEGYLEAYKKIAR
jgi:glycosyltransferase involved in cell wall biosynthesis